MLGGSKDGTRKDKTEKNNSFYFKSAWEDLKRKTKVNFSESMKPLMSILLDFIRRP